ncbi:hypothetical protein [Pseudomonas viridiflava]|uniref:hypothetical protein n=1 Tax=Pseudomonas viridiflava TaxID=33069 RepID=UPI000F019A9F|nr:hypothetical protein [Pseudomonas viridiflava]
MSGKFGMEHIYAPGAPDDGSDEYVIAKYNSADSRDNETYVYSLDQIEENRLDQNSKLRDKATDEEDTQPMTEPHDYRHELSLRDEQIRREMDLRDKSFRAEQTVRDKALDEKFAGFLAAQAERDRAWEKISDSRFERIEKDVSSIKADTKKVGEDVNGIKVTMGKYLGGAIVIGAIASALLSVALRHVFTLGS